MNEGPFEQALMAGAELILRGDWAQAASLLIAVADKAADVGDLKAQSHALRLASEASRNLNRLQLARRHSEQAVEVAWRTGSSELIASTTNELANVCLLLGLQHEAIKCYEWALERYREAEDEAGECYALIGLGNAYLQAGRYGLAKSAFEPSVERLRSMDDDPLALAKALNGLGFAYNELGRLEAANRVLSEARNLFQGSGDKLGVAQVTINIANTTYRGRNWDRAVQLYSDARAIYRGLGDDIGEALALANMGVALTGKPFAGKDARRQARRLWEQALQLYERHERPEASEVRQWISGAG